MLFNSYLFIFLFFPLFVAGFFLLSKHLFLLKNLLTIKPVTSKIILYG